MSFLLQFFSVSAVLAIVVLLGRVTGLMRDIQIASLFGLSADADLAVLLLTTPDLLINLLLAGGLSAALVPELRAADAAAASRLFFAVSTAVAIGLAFIALAIAWQPNVLMLLLAPAAAYAPVERLPFVVMAAAIPLAGLSGTANALLNARDRFLVAGAGTLVFNVAVIACLLFKSTGLDLLLLLAFGVLAGSMARLGMQAMTAVPFLRRPDPRFWNDVPDGLASRFAAALGASTVILLAPIIVRSIMSFTGEGAIAAFNHATKLVELPLGIAIGSLTVVAFTRFSDLAAATDREKEHAQFGQIVSGAFLISVAFCIPAVWFARPLADVLFGHGAMLATDTAMIGDLAAIGLLTLPAVAVSSIATAMLNARRHSGVALRRALWSLPVLAVALIPGFLGDDAKAAMAALPAFHLTYAILSLKAAGFHPARLPLRMMGWRCLAMISVMLPFILADLALPGLFSEARAALAIAAMAAAMLASGVRSTLVSLRL